MANCFWPNQTRQLLAQAGISHPIIQAPMAGGPSTPKLVAAVSNAGGLGSLGCGYLTPEKIDQDIREVKTLTNKPFAVNLFVPNSAAQTPISQKVLSKIDEYSKELGIDTPEMPGPPKYSFEDQILVILKHHVPVFSFTFGIPDQALMKELIDQNIFIIGTATCVDEGELLKDAGCNAIVAQGSEAGGHRGTFESTQGVPMIGGLALVPQLVDKVGIAVIASGGIMDGRGIAASLALGASGVQMGTAFLSCEEAGVPKPWLDSLLSSRDTSTVLTNVFSGKYARGIKNQFIDEMSSLESEMPKYPVQNSLTRPIRNASKENEDFSFMSLWAGQGSQMCRPGTAEELIDALVLETNTVLSRLNPKL